MKKYEDREKVMEKIDSCRAKSVYKHSPADCSDACRARGMIIAKFAAKCFNNIYKLYNLILMCMSVWINFVHLSFTA